MSYQIHDKLTAPTGAKDVLAGAEKKLGFVPNLFGMMANAPTLLKAYTTISSLFDETSFSPTERQIVLLTVSYENGCEYCVAAHTAIAGMQKVPGDVVAALRAGAPIADGKLQALRRFTAALVKTRGWPAKEDIDTFLAAGYGQQQVLEAVLGVGLKTLSNYANHLADTPLDTAFASTAWSKAA
jgi:uncharacterized peroxidase-related enzyme